MKTIIFYSFIFFAGILFSQENRTWIGYDTQGKKAEFQENSCIDWNQNFESKIVSFKKVKEDEQGVMIKNSNQTLFLTASKCQLYSETNKNWQVIFTGKWSDANLNQKSGCISGDCVNGYGVYKYTDATYYGFFSNSKRNGLGELRFNNCIIQSGNFIEGECCSDMYVEEVSSTRTDDWAYNEISFVTKAKNSNDMYRMKLTKEKDNVRINNVSFNATINGKYFSGDEINNIQFPKPEINLVSQKSNPNEYMYGEPRFFNDGKYMIFCNSVDGAKDGMTKSWFKVVDLVTGNTIKTYGSLTTPIKPNGYGRLEIKSVIENYLIFEYNVESNGAVLRKETKVLDLNSTSIQPFTNKHPIYEYYYHNSLTVESNDGRKTSLDFNRFESGSNPATLFFSDSLGKKKKIKDIDKLCDITLLEQNDVFFTICVQQYYHKRTLIETYAYNGVKIDSCEFQGYAYIKRHPTQLKYLVSYIDNENSRVSEYSLTNLDSLIQDIRIFKSNKNEPVSYSPTGKFIQIGKAFYHEEKLYLGLLGTPYYLNNDNAVVFDNGKNLFYYNLLNGKLIWILNQVDLLGKTDGGTTYMPDYKVYSTDGYLILFGKKYDGSKFHLRIRIDNEELSFDEVVSKTNTKMEELTKAQTQIEKPDVNVSNQSSSKVQTERTCGYKFVKPKLIVTWNDNRVSCCNPNCRNWASYYESKQSNLQKAEIQYLNNSLRAHLLENNCDENHKLLDYVALNQFIVSTYTGISEKSSAGITLASFGAAGSIMTDMYSQYLEQSLAKLSFLGYQESNADKIKRLKSKSMVVNIYQINSNYCSKKCKEFCEIMEIRCR